MHVLIFAGLMCICLPNLFLSWHDQCLKIALNAQVCFQNKKIGPRNNLNYTLALFKTSSRRTEIAQI